MLQIAFFSLLVNLSALDRKLKGDSSLSLSKLIPGIQIKDGIAAFCGMALDEMEGPILELERLGLKPEESFTVVDAFSEAMIASDPRFAPSRLRAPWLAIKVDANGRAWARLV